MVKGQHLQQDWTSVSESCGYPTRTVNSQQDWFIIVVSWPFPRILPKVCSPNSLIKHVRTRTCCLFQLFVKQISEVLPRVSYLSLELSLFSSQLKVNQSQADAENKIRLNLIALYFSNSNSSTASLTYYSVSGTKLMHSVVKIHIFLSFLLINFLSILSSSLFGCCSFVNCSTNFTWALHYHSKRLQNFLATRSNSDWDILPTWSTTNSVTTTKSVSTILCLTWSQEALTGEHWLQLRLS